MIPRNAKIRKHKIHRGGVITRIRTFLKPLSFLPAIFLMYMIFSFSEQEGDVSASISYKASCIIVETADQVFDMGLDDYQISYFATKIHGVTRKIAHMGEYFLLAIAVSFPLYVYGLHGILLMILAGGICVAFACGDEYHQSFVAGRAASMKDVGIDSIGIFFGIILVRIIGWTGRMTIFRPVKKERAPKMTRKENNRMQKQMEAQGAGYYETAYSQEPVRYRQPQEPPNYRPYSETSYYRQPQRPPYEPEYEPEYPEHSSDELSDDMPLAHLLKPRR